MYNLNNSGMGWGQKCIGKHKQAFNEYESSFSFYKETLRHEAMLITNAIRVINADLAKISVIYVLSIQLRPPKDKKLWFKIPLVFGVGLFELI